MQESSTRKILIQQYQAPLKMLGNAIELCPEHLWLSTSVTSPNRFWHIAYHALFYTHLYLAPSEAELIAWPKSRPGYQYLGAPPFKTEEPLKIDTPYTKPELLAYVTLLLTEAQTQVTALDLEGPSGFDWLPMNKFELQLYNIRHLAHHVGQLAERLRTNADLGLAWVR